jgi:hypothetical protein
MGPIFQIVFVNLYLVLNYTKVISDLNIALLIFNLLPIYPLDGSKLLNIILNKFTSFKKSHLITLFISFIFIFTIVIKLNFNIIICIVLLFTLFKVIEEFKNHNNIFNRFLLERHLKNYHYKKMKIVNNLKDMKRDYRHIFKEKDSYITEKEMLSRKFDLFRKRW